MDVTLGGTDVANQVVDPVGKRCQKLFQDFLEEWQDQEPHQASGLSSSRGGEEVPKYIRMVRELVKPERNTLVVSMKDLESFNTNLANLITEEYYRLYKYLCAAVKSVVQSRSDTGSVSSNKDFFVSFIDVDSGYSMRSLSTGKIGHLVRVSGQVVRTNPVHPELVSGTFTCMDCQTVVADVEQEFKYTVPSICRNPVCNNRSRFILDDPKSKYVDFQKVRVQEIQSELPRGCIPRSLDVVLRAEIVESAQPGDRCEFVGTLIVVPAVESFSTPGVRAESGARNTGEDSEGIRGLKALGVRDLHYKMAFLACSVKSTRQTLGTSLNQDDNEEPTPEAIKSSMSEQEWNTIYNMSQDKALYNNLISSLFPTIYGNDEVKRGILLMLFGGVPKRTPEGSSLRGDINVCIVGDPSTAKSQLLKQVADFSPRAVYTSGKASSAAGLTAAVVKDEESSEFVIEAGALMLADNGICCIDEFDKMEIHDQVAIHEAMEQQTISITKAGVKATLNARTSVLAAANPISGRYDKTKSLQQNIQMSAPIMSRFDLFFILVDDCNESTDNRIARRIVDLHAKGQESFSPMYNPEDIRRYLTFARLFKPKITQKSRDYLVEQYRNIRQRDSGGGVKTSWRITVRQLEAMIRLSESMARIHCSDVVAEKHVREAYRLLNKSIIRVDQPEVRFDDGDDEDAIEGDEGGDREEAMDTNEEAETVVHKKLSLSYEEYHTMANLMIYYLRKRDAESQEKGELAMTRQSEVVTWYCNEVEDEIDSQEELVEKKLIAEKVLHRLTYTDKVLIPLNKTGLRKTGTEEAEEDDPILVVHPNYVIDE